MNDKLIDKLLTYFWDSISEMSWEEWKATSSSDWEGIVVGAILELGLTDYIDEVYDLFYEWSDGLEEDSFFEFNSLK
jgi:hypothetical protein